MTFEQALEKIDEIGHCRTCDLMDRACGTPGLYMDGSKIEDCAGCIAHSAVAARPAAQPDSRITFVDAGKAEPPAYDFSDERYPRIERLKDLLREALAIVGSFEGYTARSQRWAEDAAKELSK